MNQVALLKLRIAFMLAVLLAMGFQLYRERAIPEPDPDEPRTYLRPVEQLAPHRVQTR